MHPQDNKKETKKKEAAELEEKWKKEGWTPSAAKGKGKAWQTHSMNDLWADVKNINKETCSTDKSIWIEAFSLSFAI